MFSDLMPNRSLVFYAFLIPFDPMKRKVMSTNCLFNHATKFKLVKLPIMIALSLINALICQDSKQKVQNRRIYKDDAFARV